VEIIKKKVPKASFVDFQQVRQFPTALQPGLGLRLLIEPFIFNLAWFVEWRIW